MKTTIQRPIYGRIEYDDETDQVSVLRRDLAERITWMLKPKNSQLLGHGYYPDTFLRACEVLGTIRSKFVNKTHGHQNRRFQAAKTGSLIPIKRIPRRSTPNTVEN